MVKRPTAKAEAPLVVLIDAPIPPIQLERVRQLSPQIEVIVGLTPEALSRAEVVYTSKAEFSPASVPNLRWIQLDYSGVDHLAHTPWAGGGVPIATARGAYSPAIAELALGVILTLIRRLNVAHDFQAQGRWGEFSENLLGQLCYGKTMGIVGYGSIGRHLARIAQAMGMTILACKRNPEIRKDTSFALPNTGDPKGVIPTDWFGVDEIERMFSMTDVAVLALPLTQATRGLIGRQLLEALPAHALLINVGRGPVLDEAALIDMLATRRLACAGLDVFAAEPLSPDSPLWKMPQVIVTPHIAAHIRDHAHLAAEVLIENLMRDLARKPLLNLADLKRGY